MYWHLFQPNIDYDVLQAHHTRNQRPCSPSPSYLNSIQNCCPKTKHACTSNSLSSDASDDQQDNLEDIDEKAKGTATDCNATNVKFYLPLWKNFLTMQRLISDLISLFPSHFLTNRSPLVLLESAVKWLQKQLYNGKSRNASLRKVISPYLTTILLPADMPTKVSTLISKWGWLPW
jgi:hypothetical protein